MVINKFEGEYFFLSNFYEAPVSHAGHQFGSNEAAFQAMKCPSRAAEFCRLNPSEAKRLGRSVELRKDWEHIKYDVMYGICKQKFLQNPKLLQMLLDTGDAELIEGNTWGDRVWGVCKGTGENQLGKILMKLRTDLRQKAAQHSVLVVPAGHVIAAALAEAGEKGLNEVSVADIKRIGAEAQLGLCQHARGTTLYFSDHCIEKAAAYYEAFFSYVFGAEPVIRLKSEVSIENLRRQFLMCLPIKVRDILAEAAKRFFA